MIKIIIQFLRNKAHTLPDFMDTRVPITMAEGRLMAKNTLVNFKILGGGGGGESKETFLREKAMNTKKDSEL